MTARSHTLPTRPAARPDHRPPAGRARCWANRATIAYVALVLLSLGFAAVDPLFNDGSKAFAVPMVLTMPTMLAVMSVSPRFPLLDSALSSDVGYHLMVLGALAVNAAVLWAVVRGVAGALARRGGAVG